MSWKIFTQKLAMILLILIMNTWNMYTIVFCAALVPGSLIL